MLIVVIEVNGSNDLVSDHQSKISIWRLEGYSKLITLIEQIPIRTAVMKKHFLHLISFFIASLLRVILQKLNK